MTLAPPSAEPGEDEPSCSFCRIAGGAAPAHTVLDHDQVVAFLDVRPVFPGHVLVVPKAHVETLVELDDELSAALFQAVRRLAAAIPRALDAHGTFVAVNNRVSQSVPHLHVHVVPRRHKDGLRGFFWPRQSYRDEDEMLAVASAIGAALAD